VLNINQKDALANYRVNTLLIKKGFFF